MPNNTESAFSSTEPAVIEAWRDMQRIWSEYQDAIASLCPLKSEGARVMIRSGFAHHQRVVGYTNPDNEEPPLGWRSRAKDGLVVPNKRLKAGKELSLPSFDRPQLPGMPRYFVEGSRWRIPEINLWLSLIHI